MSRIKNCLCELILHIAGEFQDWRINKIHTAQQIKFSIQDFSSKCEQIPRKLTEEILNGKLHCLCSVKFVQIQALKTIDRVLCIK